MIFQVGFAHKLLNVYVRTNQSRCHPQTRFNSWALAAVGSILRVGSFFLVEYTLRSSCSSRWPLLFISSVTYNRATGETVPIKYQQTPKSACATPHQNGVQSVFDLLESPLTYVRSNVSENRPLSFWFSSLISTSTRDSRRRVMCTLCLVSRVSFCLLPLQPTHSPLSTFCEHVSLHNVFKHFGTFPDTPVAVNVSQVLESISTALVLR